MASHHRAQLVCSDVDDIVAAPEAPAQCDCPVCNRQPASAPLPPTLSLAAELARASTREKVRTYCLCLCSRWHFWQLTSTSTAPWVARAINSLPPRRLQPSRIQHCDWELESGAIERKRTCPPETSQNSNCSLTAFDRAPDTRNTRTSTRPAFDPSDDEICQHSQSPQFNTSSLTHFPGCTPPHALVPPDRSRTTDHFACQPRRRYHPAHIGRFHRRLSARPPLRHPSEQRLVRNGAYTAHTSKTNLYESDITIDV